MTVSKVMGLQSCNAMMEGQNSNFQNDLGSLLCVIGTKSTYFAGTSTSRLLLHRGADLDDDSNPPLGWVTEAPKN